MKLLDHSRLQMLVSSALVSRGVHPHSATHVAHSLLHASLRGVDSHGIRLLPHYCRAVEAGRINRTPSFRLETRAAAALLLDADHAFGHHAGIEAMNAAVEAASKCGIALCGVKNSSHFGASSFFAVHAANKGFLAMAFTNADALVRAVNSPERFFGANPFCYGAPLADEEPLCLDVSTSNVAWNKILIYRRQGLPIPQGWGCDRQGRPTTDPEAVTSLEPMGGHKGFGLGMLVDILCATLTSSPISKDLLPMYTSPIEARRRISHCMVAIDVSKFMPLEEFKQSLSSMVGRIRQLPPLEHEHEPVMAPGDIEKKTTARREKEGIPVDEEDFLKLLQVSGDFQEAVRT